MSPLPKYLALMAACTAVASCAEHPGITHSNDLGSGDVPAFDAPRPCGQQGDFDGDGIPNALEDCAHNRDSDGDKAPDWQDLDSDNDGLLDGEEDRNGDGQVGCCLSQCNKPDEKWQKKNCRLVTSVPQKSTDGCGPGQQCVKGKCEPRLNFYCSMGETSPLMKDTTGKIVKDGRGHPVDSGDKSKWRIIVMGSVAARKKHLDHTLNTGMIADDLSNGTALGESRATLEGYCEAFVTLAPAQADIIWVVDQSNSMKDNISDLKANAENLFSRAQSSGLDFRIAVTGMVDPTGPHKGTLGKFCSKISNDPTDDGGTDRFLLPNEKAIFSACIENPPGHVSQGGFGLEAAAMAVKRHLPRADNVPGKIRSRAAIIIIAATDNMPGSLDGILSGKGKTCTLDNGAQNTLDTAMKKSVLFFSGITDPEAVANFHLIGGVCNNTCGAQISHGY